MYKYFFLTNFFETKLFFLINKIITILFLMNFEIKDIIDLFFSDSDLFLKKFYLI